MSRPNVRILQGIVVVMCGWGVMGIASAATAQTQTQTQTQFQTRHDVAPPSEDDSPGWGPIIGACFGVLFGGALAVWQIKGMRNRS